MAEVNLKSLVAHLNATCSEALREAAHLCIARTHHDVEVEHLLLALLRSGDSDVAPVLRQWRIAPADVAADVEKSMRDLKTGNTRTPRFSHRLTGWLKSAWMIASIDFGAAEIRSGHLLLALLSDPDTALHARALSARFADINVDDFSSLFERLVEASPEAVLGAGGTAGAAGGGGPAAAPPAGQPSALAQFAVHLTDRGRVARMDPIVGRDGEIRDVVDVLLRRRKNNPILLGEAGVGKTAVVEGLAQRIVAQDVPDPLKNVQIHVLDLALLQAGAGVRGEFENRLKEVIREVKGSPTPIVLFIDEAHTLIGAGAAAGQGDAAQLLKPALARGELRTIAATTFTEYKKHIEKDPALERRFQPITVAEPDVDTAIRMMRAIAPRLEEHHKVRILDEGIRAAVRLGDRYLTGRHLPDKAVDILDTACARVALGQAATPAALEACRRRVEALATEIAILEREDAAGDARHASLLADRRAEKARAEEEWSGVERRYTQAKAVLERILALRQALESTALAAVVRPDVDAAKAVPDAPAKTADQLRAELDQERCALAELEGDDGLVAVCVDAAVVGQVLSAWTGIPVGRMVRNEILTVQNLDQELGKRIVGQPAALAAIAKRIQASRARLEDPGKPIGVFLMSGPSGTGKTETALALADILYGGERNVITINLSEYQDAASVSNLKGSAKGLVGYDEPGALTEPVRRRPYSVVLLDEADKAHKDVLELFYQVFDKGTLEDTSGHVANFRNTVIILTSNVGGDEVIAATIKNEGRIPDPATLQELVMRSLRRQFPAAFLGRVIVLPYAPLPDDVMVRIAEMKLTRIAMRMKDQHGVDLTFDAAVAATIVERCVEVESGARNIDHIVTQTIVPDLARRILGWLAEQDLPRSVRVTFSADGRFEYFRDDEAQDATIERTPVSAEVPTAHGKERQP